MNIKTLTFYLENCDYINIKGNTIGCFSMSGIHREIIRVAANAISAYNVADKIAIELFSEANVIYPSFGQEDDHFKQKVFERITEWSDITSIEIEFDDGTKEEYLTDYDGDDEIGSNNRNQTSYISGMGNLYLVIGKDMTVFNEFNRISIEDEETIEFRKDMLDIGIEEEEEHICTNSDLPEFFRYVYLYGVDSDGFEESATVVRVPVGDNWKFVYEDKSRIIHFPEKWKYCKSNIQEFINNTHVKKNSDFAIEKLKETYKPQ